MEKKIQPQATVSLGRGSKRLSHKCTKLPKQQKEIRDLFCGYVIATFQGYLAT